MASVSMGMSPFLHCLLISVEDDGSDRCWVMSRCLWLTEERRTHFRMSGEPSNVAISELIRSGSGQEVIVGESNEIRMIPPTLRHEPILQVGNVQAGTDLVDHSSMLPLGD